MSNILGIGVDLVEMERISKTKQEFINKILTLEEIDIYNKIKLSKRKLEFLSGRFAAKEAFYKAYSNIRTNLSFKDISVLNTPSGAPYVKCMFDNEYIIHVSISHTDSYAESIVIIEK